LWFQKGRNGDSQNACWNCHFSKANRRFFLSNSSILTSSREKRGISGGYYSIIYTDYKHYNFWLPGCTGRLLRTTFIIIPKVKKKNIESLPASFRESAEYLLALRDYFEKDEVFPKVVIDNIVSKLKDFDDKGLSEKLYDKNENPGKLVIKFLHCS
jgi:hypothetical protein